MHNPPITPYLIRELSPYLHKRLRRVVSWGNSPTFANLNFYQIERELRGENVTMARKKSGANGANAGTSANGKNNVTWLNYKLTPEDVATVVSDCDDTPALCARLAGLFASGADFSIRYVPERKNFSAFAISLARGDDNLRTGISAFGGDVWQALSAVLYKCDLYASEPEAFAQSGANLGIG